MPGSLPKRAYFTEVDRTAENVVYSRHPSGRRGDICGFVVTAAVAAGPVIGLTDAIDDARVRGDFTVASALFIGLLMIGLGFCSIACAVWIRSAITTKRLQLDLRSRTLRYEWFIIGQPRVERILSAAQISHVSLSVADRRGTYRLLLHYRSGDPYELDRSHDPVPLQRLGGDIATTLGVPIRQHFVQASA